MFIELSNKNLFDSMTINQIQKIALVQTLILDGGKEVQVTDLEHDWILRICGHLIHVNADLAFNLHAAVAFDAQGNDALVTLRNGFTFVLTGPQLEALGAICVASGHKLLNLAERTTELLALGFSKDDYQKLG